MPLTARNSSGSLIILLNEGVSFVKRNMKTRWKENRPIPVSRCQTTANGAFLRHLSMR